MARKWKQLLRPSTSRSSKKNHKDVKYRECGLFIHETKQKKLGLYGIRTLELWDTGAALLPIELTSQLGAGH